MDEEDWLVRKQNKRGSSLADIEGSRKPFTAEKILVAVGTVPARRPDFVFDGTHIIDRYMIISQPAYRMRENG